MDAPSRHKTPSMDWEVLGTSSISVAVVPTNLRSSREPRFHLCRSVTTGIWLFMGFILHLHIVRYARLDALGPFELPVPLKQLSLRLASRLRALDVWRRDSWPMGAFFSY